MVANNHDYRAGIFARTLRSLQGGTSNPDLWVPQVYSTKGMDQTYRAMIKAGNERGLDLFVFDLDDILDPTFPKRETHSPALEKLLYPAEIRSSYPKTDLLSLHVARKSKTWRTF